MYPLNLSAKQVNAAFAMGVKDAQDVINKGSAQSLDDLIHYHALKKTGRDARIMKHTYGSFCEARKNGEFGDYDIMTDPFMRKYTYKAQKASEEKK
jgi:hypothetical protein